MFRSPLATQFTTHCNTLVCSAIQGCMYVCVYVCVCVCVCVEVHIFSSPLATQFKTKSKLLRNLLCKITMELGVLKTFASGNFMRA